MAPCRAFALPSICERSVGLSSAIALLTICERSVGVSRAKLPKVVTCSGGRSRVRTCGCGGAAGCGVVGGVGCWGLGGVVPGWRGPFGSPVGEGAAPARGLEGAVVEPAQQRSVRHRGGAASGAVEHVVALAQPRRGGAA